MPMQLRTRNLLAAAMLSADADDGNDADVFASETPGATAGAIVR